MIHALARLGGLQPGELPQALAASGISGGPGFMGLIASHPPLEDRIRALQARS
jgi:heat shock protein HtpX